MPATRSTTGSSRPRIFPISTPLTTKTKTKRKTTTKKPLLGGGRVKKAPVMHKRKPTMGDKVKGAVLKAEGAIERKPGKKAAGTKKMRGTDGKGARTKKVII